MVVTEKTRKSVIKIKSCIQDAHTSTKGAVVNEKEIKYIKDNEQISFVSDALFKTMLANSSRKKYACKLLSEILDMDFNELMESTVNYQNEFDKKSVEDKGRRGDLVLKLGNDFIAVEMNMKNEVNRNIEYGDRLFTAKIEVGKDEYIYPKVIVININNFYFEGHEKIIDVYYLQNDEGIMLSHKIHVQIFLPLLLKKWYTLGDEGLNELERTIIIMAIKDHEKAIKLSKGDKIMSEYVSEIKEVEKKDASLIESYDKEISYKKAMQLYYQEHYDEYYDGYYNEYYNEYYKEYYQEHFDEYKKQYNEKVLNQGLEQGKQEERAKTLENINELIKDGIDKDKLIEKFNLTKEEIALLES